MKASESKDSFQKQLRCPLESLTSRDGVETMCRFYADARADGAAIENDRDMLLYQWGIDTFNAPDVFQLSITRQINVTGESQPYQLALIFSFPLTAPLQAIDLGNQWCRSPADLPAFEQYVESSPALKATADAKPERVELRLEQRG